jgi:hypothetical protein
MLIQNSEGSQRNGTTIGFFYLWILRFPPVIVSCFITTHVSCEGWTKTKQWIACGISGVESSGLVARESSHECVDSLQIQSTSNGTTLVILVENTPFVADIALVFSVSFPLYKTTNVYSKSPVQNTSLQTRISITRTWKENSWRSVDHAAGVLTVLSGAIVTLQSQGTSQLIKSMYSSLSFRKSWK